MRRVLIALAPLALAACNVGSSVTPEQCMANFAERVASVPDGAVAQTFFTYDITDTDNPLELAGDSNAKMTIVQGNSDNAVKSFLANPDRTGPAFLAADDISLYRTAPVEGVPANTIEAGCEPPIEGAKLIRVDWHILSSPVTEEKE